VKNHTRPWPVVRLGQLAEFRNGINYSKSNFGKGLKVINVKDFGDRLIAGFDGLEEVNPESILRDECLLREGDILFVRSNGNRDLIGRSMFVRGVSEPVTHSAFSIKVRFTARDALPRFYAYLFRTAIIRRVLSNRGGGTNISNLNQEILNGLEVPHPPLCTQETITAVLSSYDDLIENNARRITLLEEIARSLYHEWFVRYGFPGHEQAQFIETEQGRLPVGWEVAALRDVCKKITDGAHRSPASVESGLPMASMKDMEDWRLDLSTCRFISQDDFGDLVRNGCKPEVGDVLIAKDGASYLKYVMVVEKPVEVVLLSSVAVLRPSDRILPYLLRFIIHDPAIKKKLANYVTGAAIPRIILKDFARFEIVVPPLPLQRQWWSVVEPVIKLIHCILAKNDRLRASRDLLLPRLISGELDVEHLDIDTGDPITEATT
jgi:type I restriction enzyme, S subunit